MNYYHYRKLNSSTFSRACTKGQVDREPINTYMFIKRPKKYGLVNEIYQDIVSRPRPEAGRGNLTST